MTLSAHLNRATARARRNSSDYGHKISPFLALERGHEHGVYEARCLNEDCSARAHISSLLEAHGRALHTYCPYMTHKEESE